MAKSKTKPEEDTNVSPMSNFIPSANELIQQGKTLGSIEERLKTMESDISDLKDGQKHQAKDINSINTTVNQAKGAFLAIRWFVGIGVAILLAIAGILARAFW